MTLSWMAATLTTGKKERGSCGSIHLSITVAAPVPSLPPAAPAAPGSPMEHTPQPHIVTTECGSDGQGAAAKMVPLLGDGVVYRGGLADGLPEGVGSCHYADDYFYGGDWKAGKKHGFGRLALPDGAYYVGHWRGGKKEGFGESWCLVEHYCGSYCNNHKHGQGILACDGRYYETEHINGRLATAVELTDSQFQRALWQLRERTPHSSPAQGMPALDNVGSKQTSDNCDANLLRTLQPRTSRHPE
eukprot:GGOE01002106.1.p1 GENE.GGOE01002106.1~~GGOE01002106.1.p1  ORF type:complete len:245 (-),score=46.28 GGOE01002106.1:85-819(-)